VGLTKSIGLVELVHEFVGFVTIQCVPIPIIYQDSISVISLVTKGGEITRTKNLRARMRFRKEAYNKGTILVRCKRTKDMKADGHRKPFDTGEHQVFSNSIQGEIK
jgi:hypothetical protein